MTDKTMGRDEAVRVLKRQAESILVLGTEPLKQMLPPSTTPSST